MLLGGLWHGAAWTFVVWGVLHGVFLIVHRLFRDFCVRRPLLDRALQSDLGTLGRIAVTFLTVALGWVFFRATSFDAAITILGRLAIPHRGLGPPLSALSLWCLMAVVIVCHVMAHRGWWERLIRWLPPPAMGLGYAAAMNLAFVLAPGVSKTFIYFQF